MKKIVTLFFATVLASTLSAQAPEKMSYQAVIRNASNNLVSSSTVGMRISVLQGSPSGTAVYVETQTPTSNANGLVSIEIGGGTVVSGNFANIDWANGPYFIQTETDPAGGTNYTITGTSQLLSVPYALHAKTADNGFSGDYNDLTNKPTNVSSFTNDAAYLSSEVDGSVTNEIQNLSEVLSTGNNANNNTIVNVGKIGVGTSTPATSAALEINSTTGSLLLPRMTTAQRDALTPSSGMLVYNTVVNKFQGYTVASNANVSNTLTSGDACTTGSRGQSFQPTVSGSLTTIEVDIPYINTPGNWTLNIYSGAGMGGTLLGTQTVSISSLGTLSVTLSTPIPVISGQSYTFNFTSTGGANACFSHRNPAPYAGGDIYIDNVASGLFDLVFTVYIQSGGWVDLN